MVLARLCKFAPEKLGELLAAMITKISCKVLYSRDILRIAIVSSVGQTNWSLSSPDGDSCLYNTSR